jgi:hypothetical protein
VRLGCDADHLRCTAAEVLPHLGNVHPPHPVMLAGGGSGLLPGRFSLRRKIKTLTHRLTVARGCKSKRNEQSIDIRAEILAAEAKNNAQEQCASGSAARLEANEALQLQIVFLKAASGEWEKEPAGRAPGGSFRNCRFEDRFHR